MSERIRWSMSLRERDDKLIAHFSDSVIKGDRSAECRRLMYLALELEESLATLGINREQLLGYIEQIISGEVPEQKPTLPEKVRQFRPQQEQEQSSDKLNKRLDALI